MSWRGAKWLLAVLVAGSGAVAAYFWSLGAWLVLPFAGLEVALLVVVFWVTGCANLRRERVEVAEVSVSVCCGRRGSEQCVQFPRAWARVVLSEDPREWYPSRLLLRAHGRDVEIARDLTDPERRELAAELADYIGQGWRATRYSGAIASPAEVV